MYINKLGGGWKAGMAAMALLMVAGCDQSSDDENAADADAEAIEEVAPAAGDAIDTMKEEGMEAVKEAGDAAMEKMEEAAGDMVDEAKEEATEEAGGIMGKMKDEAEEAAEEAEEEAEQDPPSSIN